MTMSPEHRAKNKTENSRAPKKKESGGKALNSLASINSGGLRACLFIWFGILSAAAALFVGVKYLDERLPSFYQFNPNHLHAIAREAIAVHNPSSLSSSSASNLSTTAGMVDYIVDKLEKEYPRWTINPNRKEWVANNAGGAMGAMYIIHASITEYLIIFGTTVGTEGHSGRHLATDYFYILQGEEWAYAPGTFEKQVYPPGSLNILPRMETFQYKFHEGGFALELAQGWIPSMLFFGFGDMFSSVFDFVQLYDTVRITGREMIKNLANGKF